MERYHDLNELIADVGATCELCGQKMLRADGCSWPGVYSRGIYYKRIRYGEEEFLGRMSAVLTAAQNLGTSTT